MCMTDYLSQRMQTLAAEAQQRIDVIDDLIPHLLTAQARAECLNRAAGLVAMLMGMRAELMQEKAAALRVIEDATAIRRQTKEIGQ